MMNECIEILSDSSTSSKTVDYEISDELKGFLRENCSKGGKRKEKLQSKYDLEISDDEFIFEPLDSRLNKRKPDSLDDKPSTSNFLKSSSFYDLEKESSGEDETVTTSINDKPSMSGYKSRGLYDLGKENSSDDEIPTTNFNFKEIIKKSKKEASEKMASENLTSCSFSSEENLDLPRPKKRQKKTQEEKELEKFEKEQKKKEKAEERARQKGLKTQEKENLKQIKNALKVVENCIKPENCSQYITANIDENMLNKPYRNVIVTDLENAGYKHKILKQPIENSITWTRSVPKLENQVLKNIVQDEKYILSILETSEFVPMVANNTFTSYAQSLLSLSNVSHATFAIFNMNKYFGYLKNKKKQRSVEEPEDSEKPAGKKRSENFENLPVVKKQEVDMALAELQIICKSCYVRFVEKYEDLAVFVQECSKAVAQAPYKAEKSEKAHKSNEFFQGHNKDCVKVDKNGNGLSRLWSQILQMFPLASLETSEAILRVYPTFKSLIQAYDACATENDKQNLLQDIQVRRAAGPLTNARKIGPELSRKYYLVFAQRENLSI